ncbi:hypothetical protein BDR04DRAFT_1121332 [Suillus decipiens]|nr:hypothetical protein BDR04DRAFT_1121332 [Suillus decipiens]
MGGGDLEKRNAHHKALTAAKATLPIRRWGLGQTSSAYSAGMVQSAMKTIPSSYALCAPECCCLIWRPKSCKRTSHLGAYVAIKMEKSGTYFGFYNANGLLALDRFLPINSALELSELAEISVVPVIFIHLILVNLSVASSPFKFAHSFLKPYYTGHGIKYLDVYYDIGSNAKATPYCSEVQKIIKGLKNLFIWECVVISISTHTDEDFSNSFIRYEDGDTNNYLSASVDDWRLLQFLEVILQPWQSIINHAQESYLWMLCCGSLVNNSDSFHALQKAVVQEVFFAFI